MEKMFKGLSIYDFHQQYGTNESCIDALVELMVKGIFVPLLWLQEALQLLIVMVSVGATDVGSQESATAHTLFHKLKFPLLRPFAQTCASMSNR